MGPAVVDSHANEAPPPCLCLAASASVYARPSWQLQILSALLLHRRVAVERESWRQKLFGTRLRSPAERERERERELPVVVVSPSPEWLRAGSFGDRKQGLR